jgi:hypothetical protein
LCMTSIECLADHVCEGQHVCVAGHCARWIGSEQTCDGGDETTLTGDCR